MWKQLYDSPWWLPILPTVATILLLVVVAVRREVLPTRARAFAVCFGVAIAVDAWCAGAWSPLRGAAATASSVLFVWLGDFRYFFAQRLLAGERARSAAQGAAALAWMVPIACQLVVRLPFPHAPPRVLFLVYELGLLAVVSWDARRSGRSPELARFELVQYAAWALADVLLLSGFEPAYALRVVANLVYYVAFVPFATVLLARAPSAREATA
jgi:hypothetical protein